MWEKIKTPFVWLKKQWDKFEHWVASIAPGIKTYLTAFAMLVGNVAFEFKSYLDQLPMEVFTKYLTTDILVGVNILLITLIFWFKNLSNRAD